MEICYFFISFLFEYFNNMVNIDIVIGSCHSDENNIHNRFSFSEKKIGKKQCNENRERFELSASVRLIKGKSQTDFCWTICFTTTAQHTDSVTPFDGQEKLSIYIATKCIGILSTLSFNIQYIVNSSFEFQHCMLFGMHEFIYMVDCY